MLELLVVAVSITFLFSLVIVVFGCLCVRKPSGFSSFENEYDVEAHPGTFNLEPANVSFHEENPSSCVVFEPLPDILSKTVSATAMRPRITQLERDKNESLLKLSGIQHPGFPRSQLTYIKELGQGWFGQVLEGDADKISFGSKRAKVVVKLLKDDAMVVEQKQFLEEVSPYRELSHPNILTLLGQCTEVSPMLVLLEFSPLGNLKSFLLNETEHAVENKHLVKFILDAASGLACLHKHNYVHHDFAARNCIVFPDLSVKIGDYGLSEDKFKEDYYDTGRDLLPVRWMAPESVVQENKVWTAKKFTKEGNMWSFGVTMWEILAFGEKPYKCLNDEEVIVNVIDKRVMKLLPVLRPNIDNSRLFQVMQICWVNNEERPGIEELHKILLEVHEKDREQDGSEFDKKWNELLPKEMNALQSQMNKPYLTDFKPMEVSSPITDQVPGSMKTTLTASPITAAYERSTDSFNDSCASPEISSDTSGNRNKTISPENKYCSNVKNNLFVYPSLAVADKTSADTTSCEASWVKVSPEQKDEVVSAERLYPDVDSFENITFNSESSVKPSYTDTGSENTNMYTVKFVSDSEKRNGVASSSEGIDAITEANDLKTVTSEVEPLMSQSSNHLKTMTSVGKSEDVEDSYCVEKESDEIGKCSEKKQPETSEIDNCSDLEPLSCAVATDEVIAESNSHNDTPKEDLNSESSDTLSHSVDVDGEFFEHEDMICIEENSTEDVEEKHKSLSPKNVVLDVSGIEHGDPIINKSDELHGIPHKSENTSISKTFHTETHGDVENVLEQVSSKLDQLSIRSSTDSDITTASEDSDTASIESDTQSKTEKDNKNMAGISDIYISKGLLCENKFSPNTSNRQLDTIPEITPETDSSVSDGLISDKVSEDPPSDIPFDNLSLNNETFEWDDDFEGQLYSKVRPDSFVAQSMNVSDWEFDTSDLRNKSILTESRIGEPRLSDASDGVFQRHHDDGSLRLSCGSITSDIVNRLSLSSVKSRQSASKFYALYQGVDYDGASSRNLSQKDDADRKARKSDSEFQESDSVFIPSAETEDYTS